MKFAHDAWHCFRAWSFVKTTNSVETPKVIKSSCHRLAHSRLAKKALLIFCALAMTFVVQAEVETKKTSPYGESLPFSHWVSDFFWGQFACGAFGVVFVYAQRMSADVRTPQYVVQTLLMGLAEVLFGVAAGCVISVLTYRRGSPSKSNTGSLTPDS